MSENIEKAVQTEESSETKGTDNVVLYPVSDEEKTVSAAQETSDTESKATDDKTADNTNKFSDTRNAKEASKKDAEEEDDYDLEEDFYEQQEKSRSKDEHPFREFFSNFRSKRKIEMNRDEQILSRISDEDLMEYLRMEQKRMELLQQAKEVREKRFWTTFQLAICLLSVILVIYFLKDNPVILVTILYTLGILTALRIWSKAQNGKGSKGNKDKTDA
ncbi:MAG: hypothetical protein UFV24_05505 [Dorea sp.]|uniref:hypothetical protein n=1 Tax=Dorea sp. TaxID=2040332 RepID=UPI002E77CEA4|nr:hypothetical protein [Dorea sp.]MED9704217.1 hypothetical protein [Dorea sp.]